MTKIRKRKIKSANNSGKKVRVNANVMANSKVLNFLSGFGNRINLYEAIMDIMQNLNEDQKEANMKYVFDIFESAVMLAEFVANIYDYSFTPSNDTIEEAKSKCYREITDAEESIN